MNKLRDAEKWIKFKSVLISRIEKYYLCENGYIFCY